VVKSQRLVDPESCARALLRGCCDRDCLSGWSRDDLLSQRRLYASASSEQQRSQFLMTLIRPMLPEQGRPQLRLLNRPLCVLGFCGVLGASPGKYYSVLRKLKGDPAKQTLTAAAHGNAGRRDAAASAAACAWLCDFASTCPQLNDGRVLAAGLTSKRQLYAEYLSDCQRSGERAASRSLFFGCWNARFSHLRVPRHSDHAVCSVCVDLRADLALAVTVQQRAAVLQAQRAHLDSVRCERDLNAVETRRATVTRDPADVRRLWQRSSPAPLQ
jgi:hypothetical protein